MYLPNRTSTGPMHCCAFLCIPLPPWFTLNPMHSDSMSLLRLPLVLPMSTKLNYPKAFSPSTSYLYSVQLLFLLTKPSLWPNFCPFIIILYSNSPPISLFMFCLLPAPLSPLFDPMLLLFLRAISLVQDKLILTNLCILGLGNLIHSITSLPPVHL